MNTPINNLNDSNEYWFDEDIIEEEYDEEYKKKLDNIIALTTNININNDSKNDKSTKIVSNLEYIKTMMGDLQSKINPSIDYSQENYSFTSEKDKNNLYDKMNGMINKYNYAEKLLMEKLQHEAKFIIAVGEAYASLDEELKHNVTRL